jgi:hypothetical protein
MSNVTKGEAMRIVHVKVPAAVFNHLDKMQALTKEIVGRLGCTPCHSGFDIRWVQEVEFTAGLDGKVHEGLVGH